MRKVIYISGVTASGKTTAAEKLSKFLDLPFYKADDVYSMIGREIECATPEKLVMPKAWIEYPDFGKLKAKYYRELLKDEPGDFIIEGFPLFFEQDRQLIEKVIGNHFATYFRFNLPFPVWRTYADIKFGGSHIKADFDAMNRYFEPPKHYYDIADPGILFQHHEKYQRVGFTDEKWKLLELGNLSGKTVIDLGCNAGWIGSDCFAAGASEVDGVDYNWRYLEEARAAGIITHLTYMDDFEFEKQYDITLCLAVFHYVRDKEKLLAKIAAATKELFVLEVPISKIEKPALELHDTGKCEYFIPSLPLIVKWLHKYFEKVEDRESVAPDNSHRLIFRCYKK